MWGSFPIFLLNKEIWIALKSILAWFIETRLSDYCIWLPLIFSPFSNVHHILTGPHPWEGNVNFSPLRFCVLIPDTYFSLAYNCLMHLMFCGNNIWIGMLMSLLIITWGIIILIIIMTGCSHKVAAYLTSPFHINKSLWRIFQFTQWCYQAIYSTSSSFVYSGTFYSDSGNIVGSCI